MEYPSVEKHFDPPVGGWKTIQIKTYGFYPNNFSTDGVSIG
jgi:hypothetical protein